ncbi:helix-turn-helix domain-containing protein [Gilvimarinus algae]|uniref:AraC family transcriptional regulator n=1 Tax=Gilvimarinus algae TaxID=3058037 RepID=A0ABT8TF51_9GAMM|nr:AraC family transcriptional regulator [Gilvimarinus sp. SDUM040014]MDO3382726.1 AraC family transcriptional regulator [Gilvimarinus sp. SDUM040014]
MYEPVQDGRDKSLDSVRYSEAKPPEELSEVVHNYWELKTQAPLAEDFTLHALPDACVNLLFNLKDTAIAGVTALQTTYTTLNLGRDFHYAGVQFFPGVWCTSAHDTTDSFVGSPYQGSLPLVKTAEKLAALDFSASSPVFSALVSELAERGMVKDNPVTKSILENLEVIRSVADMAEVTHKSARQLQRILKASTGFSPHDLLKVLRLQRSFKRHYLDAYTDQSHFIRSFREITGYTPADYYKKYDV